MLRSQRSISALRRKNFRLAALTAAATATALLLGTGAWAASKNDGPVRFLFSVPIPVAAANTTGGLFSWDISFVDQTTQTDYVADRSNKAIDVVNAKTGAFSKFISAKPPFAGVSPVSSELSGPDGVLTARGCIVATDAKSRVVSFTAGGSQVSDVSTGAADGSRADELAFDPKDNLLLVMNPGLTVTPFGTLISISSSCKLTVGKKIPLPTATGGAEQPQWDPGTQRFFVSIPEVSHVPQFGAVFRINPLTAVVDAMYSLTSCSPAGLALNPNNHTLLVGCSVVFDTAGSPWSGTDALTAAPTFQIIGTDGFIQAIIPGAGPSDEVWYNGGDNHFYTGSSGSPLAPSVVVKGGVAVSQGAAILGVLDGTSQRADQLVPTFNVPAVTGKHPAGTAHSVAANENNNWVLVPLAADNVYPGCLTGCVAVYGRKDVDIVGAND